MVFEIPERIDAKSDEKLVSRVIKLEHLARYKKSLKYLEKDSLVLDAGCGLGYGSDELAQHSSKVVAVDISQKAIDYSKRNYARNNLFYLREDLEKLDLSQFEQFDLITFFEVVEHLKKPEVALKILREHIKEEGYLLLSTPNSKCSRGGNPYHIKEYNLQELEELLLQNGFEIKRMSCQGFYPRGIVRFIKKIISHKAEDTEGQFKPVLLLERLPLGPEINSRLYYPKSLNKYARYFYCIAKPSI